MRYLLPIIVVWGGVFASIWLRKSFDKDAHLAALKALGVSFLATIITAVLVGSFVILFD